MKKVIAKATDARGDVFFQVFVCVPDDEAGGARVIGEFLRGSGAELLGLDPVERGEWIDFPASWRANAVGEPGVLAASSRMPLPVVQPARIAQGAR